MKYLMVFTQNPIFRCEQADPACYLSSAVFALYNRAMHLPNKLHQIEQRSAWLISAPSSYVQSDFRCLWSLLTEPRASRYEANPAGGVMLRSLRRLNSTG